MDRRLTQIAPLQQKDKGPAYLSLLSETLRTKSPNLVNDVKLLVRVVVTEDHVGLVVARQVLTELSKSLDNNLVDISEVKKAIINDTLEIVQPQLVSFEEQVHYFQALDIKLLIILTTLHRPHHYDTSSQTY